MRRKELNKWSDIGLKKDENYSIVVLAHMWNSSKCKTKEDNNNKT